MARGTSSRGRGRGRGRGQGAQPLKRAAAAAEASAGRGLSAPSPKKLTPMVFPGDALIASAVGGGGGSGSTAQGQTTQSTDQLTADAPAPEASQNQDSSTVEHAKRLLPDATFPHLEWVWESIWNEQDEQKLQDERAKLVRDIAKAPRSLEPELELWRISMYLSFLPSGISSLRYGGTYNTTPTTTPSPALS